MWSKYAIVVLPILKGWQARKRERDLKHKQDKAIEINSSFTGFDWTNSRLSIVYLNFNRISHKMLALDDISRTLQLGPITYACIGAYMYVKCMPVYVHTTEGVVTSMTSNNYYC